MGRGIKSRWGKQRCPADHEIAWGLAAEWHEFADMVGRLPVLLEVRNQALQKLATADDPADLLPIVIEHEDVPRHHHVAIFELDR